MPGSRGWGGMRPVSWVWWCRPALKPSVSPPKALYSFLAQPNALVHLDLASTDCAIDLVRGSDGGITDDVPSSPS